MSDASLGSALRGAVDLSSLRNHPAQPAPGGAAPSGSAPDVVMEANDASFGQVMELSRQIPVVVDLFSARFEQSAQLSPVIEKVVRELAGRVLLAKVDVDQSPQIVQAFQVQSMPSVVALIGGRPVPMFNSVVDEEQARGVFAQLLELAAQQGVTGSLDGAAEAGEEPQLPPLHQEAFDAIERGDNAAAIVAYEKALAENPRDEQAAAGLAQVKLLERISGVDLQQARQAAAANPKGLDEQFLVADLDIAGGHVDDAFDRLLDLFLDTGRDAAVKDRLIELFGLIGQTDPRVIAARTRLTNLLF
ncbi:co-chaperone YbbN [Microbacterium sorbitolivorans]|uniref:Co-chaperone YbbN n=1 Tax=Microbacterium sorbitolivorans TaxID=1867410 RepID=A0A367Y6F9_9MICO|nr:tetratricopeptide repeat protein [Microbacterium sorbitolivorans]RCK61446.1 co-chaperone YbbN [Microbacterium sorbitolivorans]GGF32088.1 co-chaperone YbbN [Microbacterium sorbitolivorans]